MNKLLISIALLSPLLVGATPNDPPKFVARAATLNPAPVQATPVEPVVKVDSAPTPINASTAVSAPPTVSGGAGYIMSGSNCVACVRAMTGRGQNGNAGSWRASSSVPYIGAIMIFYPGEQGASGAGHVGVVVGIHGGMISLAHCNFPGQTEFYSTGKFF